MGRLDTDEAWLRDTPTDPPGSMAFRMWPVENPALRKGATMADATATPTAPKPAWRTTEFYLSLATLLMGALYASGLISTGSTWDKLAGLVTMLLAATGHTVSRTVLKGGAS